VAQYYNTQHNDGQNESQTVLLSVTIYPNMLDVIMLNDFLLNVVAPPKGQEAKQRKKNQC
jgi:hypothetical protein